MKALIAGMLTAALLLGVGVPLAQTPPVHPNANKGEDKAQYKEQWKDCMARMEANGKTQDKPEAEHKGQGKPAGAGKATTTKPNASPEAQGEGKKMNRHEEQMQACREQLYGGKKEVGKQSKEPDPVR